MKQGLARAIAVGGFSLAIAVAAADLVIESLPRQQPSKLDALNPLLPFLIVEFVAVGAIIVWHRPANVIGWLLAGPMLVMGLAGLVSDYVEYGSIASPGSLPAVDAARAVARFLSPGWIALLVPMTFLILLFPDGKLPGPRWRPVAWFAAVVIATQAILTLIDLYVPVPVPMMVQRVIALSVPVAFLACAASMAFRFRRSRGEERQQLKWLTAAGALVAIVFGVLEAASQLSPVAIPSSIGNLLFPLLWSPIPLSIAFALFQYRLYDIDALINRTLVYGAVSATLVATYVAAVFVLEQVLSRFTVGNDLAIAASTLLIAGLFQPVRRRIQEMVDRRFYRQKYDATKTVAAFSARLRQDIDLDSIAGDLSAVATSAVQPTHASVWLRARAK